MRETPFFYGKDVHDAWAEHGRTFNPWAPASEGAAASVDRERRMKIIKRCIDTRCG